ncbi:ribosomal protein L29 [Methanococcus vannielii SB]|jgi:large subunit ribosomal protein L29|uniref:Large ribosomal subunit protein uL29 n=1 Tax=Methanococcus vannielii (strain ATCC 35089 / DSM 1224 / JCM 13029 / OCM 148 / SB) TaxID=406327 RepID=A6UQ50_METVS|nr:50S ribosomal protein L29 [Methanococcus vannielii]ABR54622.1 ribosomal protein L29 [Methanococcus vannielii SB]
MAILKASEIREFSIDEMNEKIAELKRELMKEGVNKSTGGAPSNPGKIKEIKKTIARILTIINEKEAKALNA